LKYSIEDILVELIWQWLDEVKGYQVDGEVTLGGSGRIDLVAKTPSGKYLGFEVKNQSGFAPSDDTKLFKQLIKYRNSRFLDKLYYCSQSSADMVDKLRRSVDIDMYPQQYVKGPKELGGLTVNFQDNRIDGQNTCKIVREAAQLNRKYQPKISKSSESWVCHHIWKNYGLLREGVLPNRDTNKCQYIDVMRQIGSRDPTEIYLNQEDDGYAHVGIEAKGDISLGKTVLTQLRQQYESGGITELTLAVPSFKRHSAEELLSQNTQSTLINSERQIRHKTMQTDGFKTSVL
jgi:hypothetical protein